METKEEENIKKLTENFFKSLKCNTSWENNILIVTNIPEDFEKMYEKKAPYFFAFDTESEKNFKDSELITKGSFLLKLMTTYLENKAKTTLLKIKFNIDFKNEIRNILDFHDYEIVNMITEQKNNYIYRYIFQTIFQYLNDKEQIIKHIYISNGKLIENFNIDDFEAVQGKKEEINKEIIKDTKDNYLVAKEKLKEILNSRMSEITKDLNNSLEIETSRVSSHYGNQISEIVKELVKHKENLEILKQKLIKANDKNKLILEEKINRLTQTIDNSNLESEKIRLEKERNFFINDEKHKHSLNVNNSLMNTTVVYYPIFTLKFFLKMKEGLPKEIKLNYDPLTKEYSSLFCDSCNKIVKEINICSLGHLSCNECSSKCPRCNRKICKIDKIIRCNVCGGNICSKCATLCTSCLKYICDSDMMKDQSTGKTICSNCSEYCQSCKKYKNKKDFKECYSCKKKVCRSCGKDRIVDNQTRFFCTSCNLKIPIKKPFSPF